MKTINAQAFGLSLGIFGAVSMLIMALFAKSGLYTDAWAVMMQFHMFADLSLVGVLAGMLEAGLWSYVSGLFFVFIYNRLS